MLHRELYRRAFSVFLEVVDLQGREQMLALDRACCGDPELRREVESLLRYHVKVEDRRPISDPS